jgi:hypothetical protein
MSNGTVGWDLVPYIKKSQEEPKSQKLGLKSNISFFCFSFLKKIILYLRPFSWGIGAFLGHPFPLSSLFYTFLKLEKNWRM